MSDYTAPLDDIAFLLRHVFPFTATMAELPAFAEIDADLAVSVLDEAGKLCSEVIAPTNRTGDEEGCVLENGLVRTPTGMAEAYATFQQAGWASLSGDPEYGGQGLPRTVQVLFDEMVSAANLSFGLFPGLTRGAAEAVTEHASDALKSIYLPKLISGEWTGVMAMTEAGAGSDLGRLVTRAEPQADGSVLLQGSKIFISSGDHDFGGNIVHLVLARLPDAALGTRGISLFLAPKYLVGADGSLGAANGISVGAIEHKMGIHGQPTCVINYDGARGWLVGEAGRGLNAMFTMMNAERLFVGIQGLGIADIATQRATAYARERIQGRDAKGPTAIIAHPDVRKMLLTGQSFVAAGRALAAWTSMQMDIAAQHPDAEVRKQAADLVALLTPVIKAGFTDLGFETAVLAQQVFGGHGYIREWGMEQFVRDARIAQLYEGTNGIQALDLVTRKIQPNEGATAKSFFDTIKAEIVQARAIDTLRADAEAIANALSRLDDLTQLAVSKTGDTAETGALATDYLRVFLLVSLGWTLLRTARVALDHPDQRERRLALLAFFSQRTLPQVEGFALAIRAGAQSITAEAALA
jgi:alkylation response protein AidB-like acyl-CoA dehydrogenase